MAYKTTTGMDGHPVDRKPFNWHFSAQPGATNETAGATVWSDLTKYPAGCVPAGAIVQDHATEDGRIEVADGTGFDLGIATYTRMADDARFLAYTISGVVEMIAGTGGVTKGDYLTSDTVTAYLGCAITGILGTRSFGKALTTASVGERFWAFVDFSN